MLARHEATLRELIQNADDAGTSRVRLCLDRRTHGQCSLLAPALAQWQGPALLAYNDAVFTDDDFASISRIGDSKKVSQAWNPDASGMLRRFLSRSLPLVNAKLACLCNLQSKLRDY
jgi:hypothetical protein